MIGRIIAKKTFYLDMFMPLLYSIIHSRRKHVNTCCGVRNGLEEQMANRLCKNNLWGATYCRNPRHYSTARLQSNALFSKA